MTSSSGSSTKIMVNIRTFKISSSITYAEASSNGRAGTNVANRIDRPARNASRDAADAEAVTDSAGRRNVNTLTDGHGAV